MEYWGKPLPTLFSVAATVRLRLWFGTTLKRARSCVGGATTNRSRHQHRSLLRVVFPIPRGHGIPLEQSIPSVEAIDLSEANGDCGFWLGE